MGLFSAQRREETPIESSDCFIRKELLFSRMSQSQLNEGNRLLTPPDAGPPTNGTEIHNLLDREPFPAQKDEAEEASGQLSPSRAEPAAGQANGNPVEEWSSHSDIGLPNGSSLEASLSEQAGAGAPKETGLTADELDAELKAQLTADDLAADQLKVEDAAAAGGDSTMQVSDATAEAIASAKAATRGIAEMAAASLSADDPKLELIRELASDNEHSSRILSKLADLKAEKAAASKGGAEDESSRVSLALLLEASAAAAEAEKHADGETTNADAETLRRCAQERAETDKYITDAIHRVQTTPRLERSSELRPLDRRDLEIKEGWTRSEQIRSDPQLLGECRRLVRGTQGCGRECGAKFTNLVDFAKHVDETHDTSFRPFLCPRERCPWAIIGFHERSECTRHIRTKHYKAMYSCEFQGCSKVYNRSDAFRRHVRQAHANPGSRFNRLTQRMEEPEQES